MTLYRIVYMEPEGHEWRGLPFEWDELLVAVATGTRLRARRGRTDRRRRVERASAIRELVGQ